METEDLNVGSVVDDHLVEPPDLFDRRVPARIKINLPGPRCLVGVTLDPEWDTSSLSAAITSTCASRTRRRERELRSRALCYSNGFAGRTGNCMDGAALQRTRRTWQHENHHLAKVRVVRSNPVFRFQEDPGGGPFLKTFPLPGSGCDSSVRCMSRTPFGHYGERPML